jgi:tetratricopeptide (TPR) repeat protein
MASGGCGGGGAWRAGQLLWALCAFAACATCACGGGAAAPTLAERCRQAADARRSDAADLCLPAYALSGDRATGARAARGLQSREGAQPIVEWLAAAVGDSAAGADAWLAAGVSRGAAGDVRGSLAAYERAVAMRGARDVAGQLRDAVGLMYYYLGQTDYPSGIRQAAIGYQLLPLVDRRDDRASAYINIAALLQNIGNVSTTAQLLDEARSVIPVTSPQYARLRQLDGLIERALDHPAMSRLAFRVARAFAIRDGNRMLERETSFNLIDDAIRDGEFDDAAALLAYQPLSPSASPNVRATAAYYHGLLEIARGRHGVATQLVEQALRDAPPDHWIQYLEDVHGQALERGGKPEEAEQAFLRSADAVERERDTQNGDSLKSWLLAKRRAPFEDLFLHYIAAGRLEDALRTVQRATARSTLDGLLAAEPTEPARGVAAAGERSEAMLKLARSHRWSRAMTAPPTATLLTGLRGHHVLTYFRARGDLWAIAVGADSSLRTRKIGSVADLARRVTAWKRSPEDVHLADELGARLLPDELMPAPEAPIYVVEEDPISDVSFAALRRRGELVLDHHAVGYAPSAAVLLATRRPVSSLHATVLGDPNGDLPEAREEAKEVAERLKVTPRLGSDAARAAVLDARDATLIHVAAHTVPTQTGAALRLSDGLLDASTVLDHGVTAGAIVLLTCSSAPITSRDELAALASAFIAGGAHTVVASRWAVDDIVARQFARLFYAANGLEDPVGAAAIAQRELARQTAPAAIPVEQWSTFAVVGGLP